MSADLNTILETLTAGPAQGMGAVTPQALMAQMAEENPTVALLAKYFSQRQEQANNSEASGVEDEPNELSQSSAELERAQARTIESAGALRDLREKIERIYAELETLRERNDSLAEAVGACALCWGEDVLCPVCEGEGRPGFTMPDRELFTQLIAPAVRHFLKRSRTRRPSTQSFDPQMSSGFESPKGE
jgi:hypothetical protein